MHCAVSCNISLFLTLKLSTLRVVIWYLKYVSTTSGKMTLLINTELSALCEQLSERCLPYQAQLRDVAEKQLENLRHTVDERLTNLEIIFSDRRNPVRKSEQSLPKPASELVRTEVVQSIQDPTMGLYEANGQSHIETSAAEKRASPLKSARKQRPKTKASWNW